MSAYPARIALEEAVALIRDAARSRRLDTEYLAFNRAGGRVLAFDGLLPEADLWVDALYGTGLSRPPAEAAQAMIERMNASRRPVLALDVPSGLDADAGHAPGIAVRATATICFLDPPYGQNLVPPALDALAHSGWIGPGTLCVVETGREEPAPMELAILDERLYGAARIVLGRLAQQQREC